MSGFPSHVRVVASRASGDDAVVVLDTGSGGTRSLYQVICARQGHKWIELSSGNGPGWARTSRDDTSTPSTDWREREFEHRSVGTLSDWGNAPPEAEMVRLYFKGRLYEEPVRDGVYLFAWWKVGFPQEYPDDLAFRIRGEWRPAAP